MKKNLSIILALLIAVMSFVPAFATETYVLTFNVNTDDISVIQPEPFICNPDNRAAKIAKGPTRDGYTFVEWNTSPNGDGMALEPGETITMFTSLTIYAIWDEVEDTSTNSVEKDVSEKCHTSIFQIILLMLKSMINRFASLFDFTTN